MTQSGHTPKGRQTILKRLGYPVKAIRVGVGLIISYVVFYIYFLLLINYIFVKCKIHFARIHRTGFESPNISYTTCLTQPRRQFEDVGKGWRKWNLPCNCHLQSNSVPDKTVGAVPSDRHLRPILKIFFFRKWICCRPILPPNVKSHVKKFNQSDSIISE